MCSLLYTDGGKREEKQKKIIKRNNEGKAVYNRNSKII
jgi:hypothetical protein